jgi:hypothetical protein
MSKIIDKKNWSLDPTKFFANLVNTAWIYVPRRFVNITKNAISIIDLD